MTLATVLVSSFYQLTVQAKEDNSADSALACRLVICHQALKLS